MQFEKKYFGNGHGNFDDVDFILLPNDWVNLENARVGSTDKGVIGTIESIGSNILLSPAQPSVSFVQIGSVEDDANMRFFYFLKDLYGPFDKIICYDTSSGVFYNVLFGSQVLGGLNFQKNYLIHSARIINNLLYWTDNLNQPRRINVKAAINLNHPGTFPGITPYTTPINAEVITIIRKPPTYPITFNKIVDSNIHSNQIKNNAFKFTYFYTYRDGENSTLAPHSLLANYNFKGDAFNAINLVVNLSEIPLQDVQIINVVVIYANTSNGYIVKTWNKDDPAQAAEIASHVAGFAALSFEFVNDAIGDPIDSATLAKPFDSVPLLSETLDQGTNRLFLGRNLIGYDTPTSTSLTASVLSNSGNVVGGPYVYWQVTYFPGTPGSSCNSWQYYFIYASTALDGSHAAGYYDISPGGPLHVYTNGCDPFNFHYPNYPIPVGDLIYVGPAQVDMQNYIIAHDSVRVGGTPDPRRGMIFMGESFGSWLVALNAVTGNTQILKSDSTYNLSVVFYDQYLRQCSVVPGGPKVTTPDREYNEATSLLYGVGWTLPAGAQTEIPTWARYYSVVITKSLRTSFFVQARATTIVYATKDADGNYLFTSTSYSDSNAGIAIKLDLLNGAGMGYTFNAGDILKLYANVILNPIYTFAVIDQSGDYVIVELQNLGSLSGVTGLFEIYTPAVPTASEFYYEIAAMYVVLDPSSSARRYETLSGIIPGDVNLIEIGTSSNKYLVESMSPNVTFWQNWFTNVGRIQIKTLIGQRAKDTSVKWSNTFIPGTITNGLSTFDVLDEKILPGELGPLRKLQITSKVNNELGAVMLAICEEQTASLYLGETQLVSANSNAFIAQSTGVIGTVNILKGSFGTINPESAVEFRGNVYWVDVLNGKVIQYSLNGLFPISNYKMTRYWKQFCEQYLSMTLSEIEALGSRPFIFSTVDPHHWELLITVPKLLNTPPKGYLPDTGYTDYVYPFDIWDGQAKTLVFKINAEPNFWQGAYSFTPEGYVTIHNQLFSFHNGLLYQHNNTDSYCNFFGVQYKSRLMFVCNQIPERPKVYNNISIEANMLPSLVYFLSEQPWQQVSNLQDFDFENKEGVLYCQIYRNVLTPTATGLLPNALIKGERMRTFALRVLIEFNPTTFPVELRFITLGYTISLGHTIPVQ